MTNTMIAIAVCAVAVAWWAVASWRLRATRDVERRAAQAEQRARFATAKSDEVEAGAAQRMARRAKPGFGRR